MYWNENYWFYFHLSTLWRSGQKDQDDAIASAIDYRQCWWHWMDQRGINGHDRIPTLMVLSWISIPWPLSHLCRPVCCQKSQQLEDGITLTDYKIDQGSLLYVYWGAACICSDHLPPYFFPNKTGGFWWWNYQSHQTKDMRIFFPKDPCASAMFVI